MRISVQREEVKCSRQPLFQLKHQKCTHILAKTKSKWSFWTKSFKVVFTLHFDFKSHAPLRFFFFGQ